MQTINAVSVESGQTYTTGTAFSYDSKGQLTSVVTSNSSSSGAGERKTETYTYDIEGYPTAYNSVYSYSGYGDETNKSTYEYANGRLTRITNQFASDYLQSTGNTTYTYDAAGALTQALNSSTDKFTPGGTTTTSIYSGTVSLANGVLTALKSVVNGKETSMYTVENGRITTQIRSDGSKMRYTYDAGGSQTKSEELDAGGTVTRSTTTEYGSTPAPQSVYPAKKGFPVYHLFGNTDRVVTRVTTTSRGSVSDDHRYQYQLNSKGYPTKAIRTNTLINSTQTTTYTYANCQ